MRQSPATDKIRVLLADDHGIVRSGTASLLSQSRGIEVIGEAVNGEDALMMALRSRPDVVLMDLRMPGIGGLESARRITAALPRTKVIALTAWASEPPLRLRKSGITACLSKSVEQAELEATIRHVFRGSTSKNTTANGNDETQPTTSPFDKLTSREMQVNMLILAGHKAAEIAQQLSITSKTVHAFRYRIFEKLGISGDVELAKLAARFGLIGSQTEQGPGL